MATVYGVNRTKHNTPTASGSSIVEAGQAGGRVKCLIDSYEAAALASGSIIEVGNLLPKNCTVVEVELIADALGGSVTLIVGDYEDNDRYIAESSTWNTAAQRQRINAVDGFNYKVDETYAGKTVAAGTDRQVTITTGGASATGTIKIAIYYVQD